MKILIIAFSIGKSAAGVVAEELFTELINQNPDVHIICNENFSKKISSDKVSQLGLKNIHHNRFDKLLLICTHFEINGWKWVSKGLSVFKKIHDNFKPDVVLCFTSAYGFRVLDLGYKIAKIYNIPLAIHSVDPNPSSSGWGENYLLRKAIVSIVKPYYQYAKFISATNEQMLSYQLEILSIKNNKNTKVIFNPARKPLTVKSNLSEKNTFLYLGTLYEKRNPQLIIDAFLEFNKINNGSKFLFVGENKCKSLFIPQELSMNIIFNEWTSNPEIFINKSSVLVDIDANIPNDVFISSKLSQYLMYDKPILCITPIGSPSRELTKSLTQTVFCVNHNKEEILKGMQFLTNKIYDNNMFLERESIREKFSVKNITKNILEELYSIL
ncbi:MAG: hypothetical protein ACK4EX_08860 [Thermaurantimonas sp.]|uniref:hypothetical protein n=1 Tax=Thermaurantimonas sp. TaxID=2681568 RepID=UPI0039189C9C